jgi:hypothetical protein
MLDIEIEIAGMTGRNDVVRNRLGPIAGAYLHSFRS